jgi:hypothetical protein
MMLPLCHFATLSLCHFATMPLCHFTLLLCYSANQKCTNSDMLPLCHIATLPFCHFAMLPLCHLVSFTLHHVISCLQCHYTILPLNHAATNTAQLPSFPILLSRLSAGLSLVNVKDHKLASEMCILQLKSRNVVSKTAGFD